MQISVETRNRSTFRVKPVKYKARRTLTGHEQRIWATINAASSPRLPSTSSSPLTNTANCISQMLKMAAAVLLQRPASIETISDNIDAVNTLRGNTQSNDTLYNQPKFDKNKGKTNFPSSRTVTKASRPSTPNNITFKPWHTTSRPPMTSRTRPALTRTSGTLWRN